ncbi:unnamed protein product [Clonostachys rosea]|uniref:AAA+ ATPase domain-containing protein n=1 Tax=Bionectria ochroleuca TaxID=29856 RepID=A0ABY6ULW2_BIOOC|nr:unnamed protein product [Clonostachys rosea]
MDSLASKRPVNRLASPYSFLATLARGSPLDRVLTSEVNGYASIALIFGLFSLFRTLYRRGGPWIFKYLTSTIYLRHDDEAFEMLSAWINAHGVDGLSRTFLARVSSKRRDKRFSRHSVTPDRNKEVQYSPWEGSFMFWYKGRPISYRTTVNEVDGDRDVQVALTCFGRSSRILKTLLSECREFYLAESRHKTGIFKHRQDMWRKAGQKNARPLTTVILPSKEKDALINDIETFLDEDTKIWYTEHAIPYQRGYLLCGPPGTGKSSMSLSIAGHFDMDIYVINLTNANDQTLEELFLQLPDKCLVLLEDIDAAGLSRQPQVTFSSISSKMGSAKGSSGPLTGGVTLSGLLNTLDGVSSQSGRIVVMTTNYASDLDQALIRPGRVDFKVEFQLADKDVVAGLFRFVYGQPTGESLETKVDPDLEEQVNQFASLVPASSFSQAEILSHLLQWRKDPAGAIENGQTWVHRMLQDKSRRPLKTSIKDDSLTMEGDSDC